MLSLWEHRKPGGEFLVLSGGVMGPKDQAAIVISPLMLQTEQAGCRSKLVKPSFPLIPMAVCGGPVCYQVTRWIK